MPLIHGKSKKAFKHNVETEMDANPGPEHRAQNLAIAYAVKRKAQRKCEGGKMMAKGGMLTDDGYQSSNANWHQTHQPEYDEQASGFVSHEGNDVKHDGAAMSEDERLLNQHGEIEEGPEGVWMAEGGDAQFNEEEQRSGYMDHPEKNLAAKVMAKGGMLTDDGYQSEAHDEDMVGRIIRQRQKMFSKGGRVANTDKPSADSEPAEYDDLHLRDDLESTYGDDDNAGDDLDNARENHDREDIIKRVMASRRKKDRLPSPA